MDDLIERLEAAERGSRGLDAMVEVAVRKIEAARTGLAKEHWAKWRAAASGLVGDRHTQYRAEPVTTSLDCALALAERVLPGWSYGINGEIGGGATVVLEQASVDIGSGVIASPGLSGLDEFEAEAATPALALCAAILRAKDQRP